VKPTLGIVSYLLSDAYILESDQKSDGMPPHAGGETTRQTFFPNAQFDECLIYDGGKVQPDTLYLCMRPDGAPSAWRNGMAIGLEAAPTDLPASCCYFQAREKNARKRRRPAQARLIELANAVHAALAKLDRWALATERACSEAPDFSALLNLCERELGFVSILVNKNLRYLAVSDGFAAHNPWFNRADTSMDTEMTNQLTADAVLDSVFLFVDVTMSLTTAPKFLRCLDVMAVCGADEAIITEA